jgi:hypothetical protein
MRSEQQDAAEQHYGTEVIGDNLPQCHFVHKIPCDLAWIETGLSWWKAGD